MRTHNALEALAAAAPPFLAEAESLVDEGEEDRILERILTSPRSDSARSARRHARPMLALAGIVILAGLFAVAVHEFRPATKGGGRTSRALTGAAIHLAGYRFRTPAGFKASGGGCTPSGPILHGFAAAASADGGCLFGGVLTLASTKGAAAVLAGIPRSAEPVAVEDYQGYLLLHAPRDGNGCTVTPADTEPCVPVPPAMELYVYLPEASGPRRSVYVDLLAQGLTEEQLIAVAESGLPTLPNPPTTTTG